MISDKMRSAASSPLLSVPMLTLLSMIISMQIVVTTAYSVQCPDHWEEFISSSSSSSSSTSCYHATDYDVSMSQSKCQNHCRQKYSSSLVSIENMEENEFIFYLLNKNASFDINKIDRDAFNEHFYWIGLYNSNAIFQGQRHNKSPHDNDAMKHTSSHEWHWIYDRNTSFPLSKHEYSDHDYYFNWKNGQPDNYCGMEHCAGISLDNGMWEDIDCRVQLRCVCELTLYNDDDDDDATQSFKFYNATLAIREPKGKPYASGGPYRSCPRDSEDFSYVIILECSIILAFAMLFGAAVAISSSSFLPSPRLKSCLPSLPSFFQGIRGDRQKLPTDIRDEEENAVISVNMTSKDHTYNNHISRNNDGDDDYDDDFSAIMVIQVPSTATSGSVLEVIDPRNNECRVVVVPDGVVAGEYFEVHHDTWKVVSRDKRIPENDDDDNNININNNNNNNNNISRARHDYEMEGAQCFCLYGDPQSATALISPKTRIPTEAFDCIRGMGSLQVSLGHFFTFYADFENAATPEFGGGNAVLMFFVMSGFLMTIGYAAKGVKEKSSSLYGYNLGFNIQFAKNFIQNRIARLCPVAWFSLLVCIPLSILSVIYNTTYRGIGTRDVGIVHMSIQYVASFFFLQSWHKWLLGPNGPLWSLCAQTFCYFSFPILIRPMLTVRNDFRFLTEIIFYWAIYIILWNFQNSFVSGYDYISAHINPINKLPIFMVGMIFASQALVNSNVQQSERTKYRWAMICNIISIFVSAYFFVQIGIGFSIENAGFLTRVAGEMFLPTTYGLWLYALTKAPDSYAYRLFCWKPFRIMGELSFSWYVFHIPILQYYSWLRVMLGVAELNDDYSRLIKMWELIILVPMFFLVSYLSYHYLETPARNWLSAKKTRVPKTSALNPIHREHEQEHLHKRPQQQP